MRCLLLFSGIVPNAAIQMDVYWKEMNGDSDWVGFEPSLVFLFSFCFILEAMPFMFFERLGSDSCGCLCKMSQSQNLCMSGISESFLYFNMCPHASLGF